MPGNISNFKGAIGVRGGNRPGAGSKLGQKKKKTLEREVVAEAINQRIFRIADDLINAQASLARGIQVLYRVKRVTKESGKIVESKPEIVTDPLEIGLFIEGSLKESPDKYYYMTTHEPHNGALDSIFNRALGKPKETMDLQVQTQLKVDF